MTSSPRPDTWTGRASRGVGRALLLCQDLDSGDGQAAAWDSLGFAHHHLGHHPRAIDCYQHALELHRSLADRSAEADTLTRLGDVQQSSGNADAARTAWQHALTILDDLDRPDADHVRARLRRLEDAVRRPGELTRLPG